MATQIGDFTTKPRRQIPKAGQTTENQAGDDGTYEKGYAPTPRFVSLGNGTIRDNATGLTWVADPSAIGADDTDTLVIEDCEDLWTDGVATSSLDTGVVGTNCIKLAVPAAQSGQIMAYETIAAADLQAYNGLVLYVKTSVDLVSGDIALLISEAAALATPAETINLPAITAASGWNRIVLQFANTTRNTRSDIITIGFKMNVNMDAVDFYADDIRASKWGFTASPLKMPWTNGLSACEGLTYASQSDWRLPNAAEMLSLVSWGAAPSTTLITAGFTNFQASTFHTSNTLHNSSTVNYTVFFGTNPTLANYTKITYLYVIPVRGG